MKVPVRTIAEGIGKGVVAGVLGTAAMTVSSTLEAKARRRAFSTAPADATAKVLGIKEFASPAAYSRFSNLSHWGYGTAWGVPHGVLRAFGLSAPAATAAHGTAVWGNAQLMLPALDVAPPFFLWPRREVAIDLWHHLVYAVGTGLAYGLIERR